MAVAAAVAAILFASSAQAQTDLITNGQFASGLTGWTTSASTLHDAAGTCSYNAVTAPGSETLTSTPGFPAPAGATTIALGSVSLTATGFKSCVLYQDIAIPAGTTSVQVSLSSGNKLVGGLAPGDTALFAGLYPTTSVPDFNTNNAVGTTRLVVGGAVGVTTLSARGPTTVNVTSVAGTTVRFAIINAMQSPNTGTGAFIPGANDVLGIGNVHVNIPAPTVTARSPSSGTTAGGTSVTITGTNFAGVTAVKFGSTDAAAFNVVSGTSITATSPAGSAGAVDITVTTPAGTSATGAADRFTFVAPAPTVTSVSPASGPTAGGTSVTITGTNLTGATGVTFGGTAATGISVVNATTITAATPARAAGTVSVVVTTPGGSNGVNALYTYTSGPTVTSVSPNSGPTAGGTSVTIAGTSFTGATSVTFGGTAATSVVVVNATTITAITPAGAAGAASVVVTTASGSNPANTLFAYVVAMAIATPTLNELGLIGLTGLLMLYGWSSLRRRTT